MASVTIQVQSDAVGNPRVPGVVVEFYDLLGVFQTSGTTDSSGQVTVSLPVASYDVFMFLQGFSVLPSQPQRIVVNPTPNVFLVTGHLRVSPESTDPKKTTVSGFVVGGDGSGSKTRLSVKLKKSVTDLGNSLILPESLVTIESDDTGYFEFELLRGKKYTAYFRDLDQLIGLTPPAMDLIVPNLPGINFDALFFPIQIQTVFSASSISLSAGGPVDQSITATTTYSDGSTNADRNSVPWSGLTVATSNGAVVAADIQNGILLLTPIAAGTAVISITRYFIDDVQWDNPPAFVGGTVTVTVV